MAASTTKASWGVNGSVDKVSGVVTDLEIGHEAILGTQQNELGAVIQQTMYDKKTTMTATVEVASTINLPAHGAAVTIAGKAGYITSARLIENNTSYKKISITAEFYTNCSETNEPS